MDGWLDKWKDGMNECINGLTMDGRVKAEDHDGLFSFSNQQVHI